MTKLEENINKLNIAIEKLTVLEEQNSTRIKELENRVNSVELKPLKDYNKRKDIIISSICSGIGGLILGIIVWIVTAYLSR